MIASAQSFILNGFNDSFSVNQVSFLVRLLIVSFFLSLTKIFLTEIYLGFVIIFFGSITFRFGSHSLILLAQVGLVKPIQTLALTRSIAATTWLHVSPIPAIHVQ